MIERFRETIDARARSPSGEQRFGRASPTPLSRVNLVPLEPLTETATIRWRDARFELERGGGQTELLSDETRFTIGRTTITWLERRERFPVDVERERALVSRADEQAWQVYTDELLQRGDPLGFALQAGAGEFDVPFTLEVQPLFTHHLLHAEPWPTGLFRELVFSLPFGREVEEGWFAASLTHARAWMVEHVRLELAGSKRRRSREPLTQAEAFVHRYAGPHLRSISFA